MKPVEDTGVGGLKDLGILTFEKPDYLASQSWCLKCFGRKRAADVCVQI